VSAATEMKPATATDRERTRMVNTTCSGTPRRKRRAHSAIVRETPGRLLQVVGVTASERDRQAL
jgi:hypothetical protein